MKIHFIGIGGIGVSALAQYYLTKGHQVFGSDLVKSEITETLKKSGAKISIGKNIIKKDADLIIYSPAVSIKYQKPNMLSYPEALGELTKKYFTIAVCGTHGKSTTASMLGLLLTKAGLDPTVILGTKLKEFNNSNFRAGKSKYLIIEADEHFASFLSYWPKMIVLTNIEADHLDYYKNFKNYKKAFKEFIARLPKNGVLVGKKTINKKDLEKLKKILKVPGKHNIDNAFSALSAARSLKIPDKVSFYALSEYNGCWRRFDEREIKIKNHGGYKLKIIHDYGHHPTEIKATLEAAREKYPDKKIWCVYQPHQYQRTYYLFNGFIKSFRSVNINKVIITDIYDVTGREEKNIKGKISSEKLTRAIKRKNVIYVNEKKLLNFIKKNLNDFEILIIMGAGDIYNKINLA